MITCTIRFPILFVMNDTRTSSDNISLSLKTAPIPFSTTCSTFDNRSDVIKIDEF